MEKVAKKGRKSKNTQYNIVPGIVEKKNIENENVIVYLPINSQELNSITDDNNLNENFALISDNLRDKLNELEDSEIAPVEENNLSQSLILPPEEVEKRASNPKEDMSIKKIRVLDCLYEFNNNQKWPKHTISVACQWCIHKFNTIPVGVPQKLFRDKFYLKGCFCSYNCAAAYLFDKKEENMFEQYSLLNIMYSRLNKCGAVKIKPAPPRETLQLLGGPLNITEFRESSLINNKNFNVINPPIISIVPQIEEVTMENVNRNNPIYSSISGNSDYQVMQQNKQHKSSFTLQNYMSLKISNNLNK